MTHNCNTCNCLMTSIASQNLDELQFEKSICCAALQNDLIKVSKLIVKGHINNCDNFGYTALHYAARGGNLGLCRMLIEAKINVNAKTNGQSTALHRAAMMGHHNIVQLLLQNFACPNYKNSDGQTPLHKSAENGSLEVSLLLLEANAELKLVQDNHGRYAADCITTKNKELIALLHI